MVDYSGLENRRAERHRGFESLPFRREASSESCSFFLCPYVYGLRVLRGKLAVVPIGWLMGLFRVLSVLPLGIQYDTRLEASS